MIQFAFWLNKPSIWKEFKGADSYSWILVHSLVVDNDVKAFGVGCVAVQHWEGESRYALETCFPFLRKSKEIKLQEKKVKYLRNLWHVRYFRHGKLKFLAISTHI